MLKIYDDNGLPFFNAAWLRDRRYAEQVLADTMKRVLLDANKAWVLTQIEAPCLIPEDLVNPEYDEDSYFRTSGWEFALKPETTASSYAYAKYALEHQMAVPPLCVFQASKSFRRENDQVTKNVRLKEFYQMEFQCIVTDDTKKDYQDVMTVIDPIGEAVKKLTGLQYHVVTSDRLPKYSEQTLDIEVDTGHKWLEVCSISKRTDVPFSWVAPTGKKWPAGVTPEVPDGADVSKVRKLINYEFAFGLDRIVYAMQVDA
jgi:glycyl-tRNA synthetase